MFTINQDKEITYTTEPEAGTPCFNSAEQLCQLADAHNWSREYLESVWNGFAGVVPFDELKPVKKFRNRPYGIAQIWKAIQRLASAAPVEVESIEAAPAEVEPVPAPATKPKAVKRIRGCVPDRVTALISRKTGASIAEIMEQMKWTATHTVRGRISILKSSGLKIESFRHETRGRVYRAVV